MRSIYLDRRYRHHRICRPRGSPRSEITPPIKSVGRVQPRSSSASVDISQSPELRFQSTNLIGSIGMATTRLNNTILSTVLLLTSLSVSALAPRPSLGQAARSRDTAQPATKLVIVIVVDQFRYDFLER